MTRAPSRLRTVTCLVCGMEFQTRHSQGKYCSSKCSRQGERKSWREYGHRNLDSRRAYQARLYALDPEKVAKRIKIYRASPAGKRAQAVKDQNQKTKFPEKIAARKIVSLAIASGRLIRQPCARCGCHKSQAHHSDYSQPLNVQWLCVPCHVAEHGRSARGASARAASLMAAE